MSRRYLITGGAGFIGSNFVRYLLNHEPSSQITNVDAMTYAGVQSTIDDLDTSPNHTFIKGNICDQALIDEIMPGHEVVVHFAAQTHVDRSIDDPIEFLMSNVVGTGVLLGAAVRHRVRRFVHVSTDEVYGSVDSGSAKEDAPLHPSSPYSSSKAGSDLLVLAYHATFGLATIVTRCTNNYGPYQFPEKAIPLFVTRLIDGGNVPLYGNGLNQRDWLHVEDHCSGLHTIVDEGQAGQIYNIGTGFPISNIELVRAIMTVFGVDESRIDWVDDRPGHDYRYAVDSSKLRSLGWAPRSKLGDGLTETVEWYRLNENWWRPLIGSRL